MKTTMLLDWKHSLSETPSGFRLDMLALEESPTYIGGLVGGRIRWFEKSAVQAFEIQNGRAIIDVSRDYAARRNLQAIKRHV